MTGIFFQSSGPSVGVGPSGVEVEDGGSGVQVSAGVGVMDGRYAVGDWVCIGVGTLRVASIVVALGVGRVFLEKAGKKEALEQAIKNNERQMKGSKSLRVIEYVS
jgi:hypothetical protein